MNIRKNTSFQTIILIILYMMLSTLMSEYSQRFLYTVSVWIRGMLKTFMPIAICFFISHTIQSFKRKALLFIIAIFMFEGISNFSSVWYAFFAAKLSAPYIGSIYITNIDSNFTALQDFFIKLPSWWSPAKGGFCGLVLGCISAYFPSKLCNIINANGYKMASFVMTRIFARLIPLFVLGFVVNMYNTGVISHIAYNYATTLLFLFIIIICYTLFLFALGSGFSIIKTFNSIKNLLGAVSFAFTSGCSLSTMPLTIAGTSKNLDDKEFAKAVIPATTNIQQIGDCMINAFLCCILYMNFYGHFPDSHTWLLFSISFTLTRYLTASIMGGAIFLMIPLYEYYLHFNADMISIIIAMNIILDPIVTAANVMNNGALCRIFELVWNRVKVITYHRKSKRNNIVAEHVNEIND